MDVYTEPAKFDVYTSGFILIGKISKENQEKIHHLQQQLEQQFPGKLWLPHGDQLHMTLLHWVSPDEDCHYDEPREQIFEKLKAEASEKLENAIPAHLSITVQFDIVESFPAAIIVKGHDDGSFDRIRNEFTQTFNVPEATRRPPKIIHTTIGRFYEAMDYKPVEQAVQGLDISFSQEIKEFYLIQETKIFTQEHTILRTFPATDENSLFT